MRLRRTETSAHIPGQPKPAAQTIAEWICPDCDYFEEADEEKT
jgi:hypothetical protein